MEDGATVPVPTVVTTQPTLKSPSDTPQSLSDTPKESSDTPDTPDGVHVPLNESLELEKEEKRRRDNDCCYYNDCIFDEGDILDWFCLCRCFGHILQGLGHGIGSCCEGLGDCCEGCGECMCHGCCEAGGETGTDAADGADCDCGDCDCDCGDCDCF